MTDDNKKPDSTDNDNGNVVPDDPDLVYFVDKGEKKPNNYEERDN